MSETKASAIETSAVVQQERHEDVASPVVDTHSNTDQGTSNQSIALLAGIAGAGGLVGAAVLAAAVFFLWGPPPKLAVVDLREIMEIEETQLTLLVSRADTNDEDRLKAYSRLQSFGGDLTKAINQIQGDCKCTLLNRSAYVGEVPHDYTPELKEKLGMAGVDLEQLRKLTADSVRATMPSINPFASTKGK